MDMDMDTDAAAAELSPPPPVPSSRGGPAAVVMGALVGVAALFGAVVGALQLGWHARMFGGRIGFPLDLEWMEGGMLVHAQRIAAGQPIYTAPSLDFIPFLYTPLYPAVVAGLSKIAPLGYVLGRAVSLLAFAAALGLLVWAAVRQLQPRTPQTESQSGPRTVLLRPKRLWRGGGVLVAIGAAGTVAAGYAFSGAFYDLARSDSLLLFLEVVALVAAVEGTSSRSAALAGIAIAAAFFTKQTASVLGVAIGVGLLLANPRRGLIYGVVAALGLGLGVLWLTKASDGWFWTYIFKLHQSHAWNGKLAFYETPRRIWEQQAPVLIALVIATGGLALAGRLRRQDAVVWAAALGGLLAACVGFGTQWAFHNALIPAVYFPAFAVAVLGARLVAHALEVRRVGAVACAGLCAAGLGLASLKAGPPDSSRFVPKAADRAAAARFLERLRLAPGDGYIPFHPFYATLAGKRPFAHRMGVLDVGALLGRPAGLDQAMAEQKFPFVILDWKSQPGEWPHLDGRYHTVPDFREGVDAVRMFSGAQTWPIALLVPTRAPPPLPAGGVSIADFESGAWNGWTASAEAFGPAPAPTPAGLFGRFAADSGRYGTGQTGTLRSLPFTVTGAKLRFTLSGPRDPALRVLLLDGPETVYEASPTGDTTQVEWNVSRLLGRSAVLVIEDRSTTAGLAVDEIVGY